MHVNIACFFETTYMHELILFAHVEAHACTKYRRTIIWNGWVPKTATGHGALARACGRQQAPRIHHLSISSALSTTTMSDVTLTIMSKRRGPSTQSWFCGRPRATLLAVHRAHVGGPHSSRPLFTPPNVISTAR